MTLTEQQLSEKLFEMAQTGIVEEGFIISDVIQEYENVINHSDEFGRTPLMFACENGNLRIVASLLVNGASLYHVDIDSRTPLMYAVEANQPHVVQMLMECRYPNINAQDIYDQTALMMAIRQNNPDIIRMLVNHGAYPDFQDANGSTLDDIEDGMTESGHTHLDIQISNLFRVCRSGVDDGIVDTAIELGFVRHQNDYGDTPLAVACRYGNYDIVLQLLEAGINTEIKDVYGLTPIMRVLSGLKAHQKIFDLLVGHGASYKATFEDEMTILMYACRYQYIKIVKSLLGVCQTSYVTLTDKQSQTALMYACENDNVELVKLVLEKGSEIDAQSYDGKTALAIAAMNGNINVARYLLEQGADSSLCDYNNLQPYEHAEYWGHHEIVDLLLM